MTILFTAMALISAAVTAALVQPLKNNRKLAAAVVLAPLIALTLYVLFGRPDL